MNIVRRVRIRRLPFTKRPCAKHPAPEHPEQDDTETQAELGAGFPLGELPVEILAEVISYIIPHHLPHPRKVCYDLPEILSLRFVNRTWAKEISHALHLHITLPNIPRRLLSHYIPPTAPAHQQRRNFLASALFNSSLSLKNRHVGTPIIKALHRALKIAEYIESQPRRKYPVSRRKEVLRMLCTAVAQNETYWKIVIPPQMREFGWVYRIPSYADDVVVDAMCVAVVIGAERWFVERAKRLKSVGASGVFGHPRVLAREWGRREVLEWLGDGSGEDVGKIERREGRGAGFVRGSCEPWIGCEEGYEERLLIAMSTCRMIKNQDH